MGRAYQRIFEFRSKTKERYSGMYVCMYVCMYHMYSCALYLPERLLHTDSHSQALFLRQRQRHAAHHLDDRADAIRVKGRIHLGTHTHTYIHT